MNEVVKLIIMLSAAILPAFLLGLYIWKKDPKPEPTKQLIKAAAWGIAICLPVAFVELIIQKGLFFPTGGAPITLFGTTIEAFFVAALPEEAAKLFALWLVLRKNPYFDEHFDGIVYAVYVGLGFAVFENIFYVLGSEDWMTTAIMRALLAVPGHYAFAILMGYYYSVYHFVDHSKKKAAAILLVPFLAHGVYDALAMSSSVNPIVGGVCFMVLIYFCIKMQRVAQRKVQDLITKDKATI